jgi:hypothetical protein
MIQVKKKNHDEVHLQNSLPEALIGYSSGHLFQCQSFKFVQRTKYNHKQSGIHYLDKLCK